MRDRPIAVLTTGDPTGGAGLGLLLRRAGVLVDQVPTAAEVIRRLTAAPPDLLVVEGRPPDLGIAELCRRLKSDPATAGVSLVVVRPAEGGEAIDGEADAKLDAPVAPEALVATLVTLLARRREPAPPADGWAEALERHPEGLAILGRDGRVVRHNRAFAERLGFEPDGSLAGRLVGELGLGGGTKPRLGWSGPLPESTAAVEWRRGDRWLRAVVEPTPRPGGDEASRGPGAMVTISDATEGRRLREQVAESEASRLAGEARIAELEREARALQGFAAEAAAAAGSRPAYRPLRESDIALFSVLFDEYDRLIDLALKQRNYQVDRQAERNDRLRALASKLAGHRAGPRDVIELHAMAMRQRGGDGSPHLTRALSEEGRLLVLELMGHLASRYRTLATAGPTAPDPRKATG